MLYVHRGGAANQEVEVNAATEVMPRRRVKVNDTTEVMPIRRIKVNFEQEASTEARTVEHARRQTKDVVSAFNFSSTVAIVERHTVHSSVALTNKCATNAEKQDILPAFAELDK